MAREATSGAAAQGPARVASERMRGTLPDGPPLQLPHGAPRAHAPAAIGPGLARAALAVKQNGRLRDLTQALAPDEPVEIVTERSGADALELIRHDAAHVLAT